MAEPTPPPATTTAAPNEDRFRFRASRKSDGTEITSAVIAIPKGWGRVGVPYFHDNQFAHSQNALLVAPAPGLDGQKVRFKVETSADKGATWAPFEEAIGEIVQGQASAVVKMHHPARRDGSIPAAHEPVERVQYRVTAALV